MSRPRGRPVTPTSALVPAASRVGTALGDVEAVLNSDAIEVFARAVGGRDQLADTLAVAGHSPEIERITTLLLDPRYASWSLARLCQTVGITVAELFASYRKALIARAHIEASHIIASKLPPVVTDVMDKARPSPVPCDVCHGTQTIDATPCWRCEGTGRVLSEPTVERHKLALELGQLLEKKGGLVVQQNNLAANLSATAPGALEQLQQAVGDLLFGGGRRPDGRADDPDDPPEVEEIRDDPPETESPREPNEDDRPLPFTDPPDPAGERAPTRA